MRLLKTLIFTLLILPLTSLAHVKYIANEQETIQYGGPNIKTLLAPLSDPFNIFLFIIGGIILFSLIFLYDQSPEISKKTRKIAKRVKDYHIFVPSIIRVSLGILLISSSTKNLLLSPVLDHQIIFSKIQLILGFLIITGLFQFYSSIALIVLYTIAVALDPYLLGSMEILAMAMSLMLLPNKPGLDDLLGIKPPIKINKDLALKITYSATRIFLGISLLLLAIYEKFMNPDLSSLVVVKTELQSVINVTPEMWTLSAGIIEALLGLLLVLNIRPKAVTTITFVVLSLSFFYFKEDVASHITIFAALAIIFILSEHKMLNARQ